jgi:hypothetical protein
MKAIHPMVVGGLLVVLTACSSAAPGPRVGAEPRGLQVLVENETFNNLRVFAVISNSEVPLGRVDAMRNQTLRLPQGVSGTMQLVARTGTLSATGSGHLSEPFSLSVGHRLTWKLRDSPGASQGPRISSVHIFQCEGEEHC